ncbi:LysR family transcriptional regulator [Comamonas endophytica]|uniref:LysR family transcriptional regulator n=1 Tax=Comamonas endophytica TaxID=2949090 RepID=UPI001E35ED89|nr:LysR family transcriptional regulator [Acidovorax sp. D4N7]
MQEEQGVDAGAIEYFVLVARTGSIARAAAEIGIEPSTLARHIGRMETDSGLKLFHRSGRGMVLTDAGSLFLQEAGSVVDALAHARRAIADLSADGPSQIVIAAQPTIAQVVYPQLGHALRGKFPKAHIRLIEGLGNQVVGWLQEGKTDVAIMYVPSNPQIVDYDLLVQEPLYAFLPPGHSMPHRELAVEDFLDFALILPSTPHGIRGQVEAWAKRHGKRLRIALEHDGSTFVTRRLVQAGHGCSVGPLAAVYEEEKRGLLQSVRLVGADTLRTVAVATAQNRPPVKGLHDIRTMIRQVTAELVMSGQWHGVQQHLHASTLPGRPAR